MASSFGGGRSRSPELPNARDLVYCHACSHEWYQNPQLGEGECPNCHSGAIEIVEDGNDPRPGASFLAPNITDLFASRFRGRPAPGADSDPEEVDIEDLNSSAGARRSPFDPNPFAPRATQDRDPFPVNPTPNTAEIFSRFLQGLMQQPGGAQNGGNGEGVVTHETLPGGATIHRHTFSNGPNSSVTITTATSTSRGGPPPNMRRVGGGGPGDHFGMYVGRTLNPFLRSAPESSSPSPQDTRERRRTVTVVSSSLPSPGIGNQANVDGSFPFRFWSDVLGGVGNNLRNNNAQNGQNQHQPPELVDFGFQQLLASVFNPAGAVHGDAVYTQEALDRIIERLMEASPGTNAAPPASSNAIETLQKKIVDDEMLGADGKAECTICIDEITKGDEATVLPCKHWYHGECVIMWLREHNTCPICRKPIEERGSRSGGGGSGSGAGSGSGSPHPVSMQPPTGPTPPTNPSPPRMPGSFFFGGPSGSSGEGASWSGSGSGNSGRNRRERDMAEAQERLNRIRNLAGLESFQGGSGNGASGSDRRVGSPPGAWPGPSSGFSWQSDDGGHPNVRISAWGGGLGHPPNEEGTTTASSTSAGRSTGGGASSWGGFFGGTGGSSGSGNGNGNERNEDRWVNGSTTRSNNNRWSSYGSSGSGRDRERHREGRDGNGSGSGSGAGSGAGSGGGHGPFNWFREHFGGRR
ncbi:hypothetical protein QBC44DRAFT_52248 [Cladorrhinum sp. PSN332]|nr:hypothetical protein QBC44DRAFT_52248 [Cladorrhinum sp. PSN332]